MSDSSSSSSSLSSIHAMIQHLLNRPISVVCALFILSISSLNVILSDPVNSLSLIPVNTLIANKFIWNVITCAFYEKYAAKILLDIFLVLFTIKPMEIHSIEQFGLYILASIIVTSFCTSAIYFISFFISKVEAPLVQPTYGFSGLYMTLLTYCRFQYSNESVHFTFPQITYQNLPILYLFIQTILYCFGLYVFTNDILFTMISLLVAWTYLRFIYRYSEDGPLGNHSDDFAFVSMFPEALRPVTVPLTTAFYNMGVMIGTFPPLDTEEKRPQHHLRYHNGGNVIATSTNDGSRPPTMGGSTYSPDPLQERRRAKAMKLLDAKLAQLSKEGDGWEVTDVKDIEEEDEEEKFKIDV